MPQMRILLALMFLAPLVGIVAVKSGVDQILPLMIGMSAIAIIAQIIIELRYEEEE